MPNPANPPVDAQPQATELRPVRVMLSLDASSADLAVLDLAVNVAALLRGEVCGLLLENEDLLRVAGMPFAREVGLTSALERTLQPEQLLRSLRANMRRIESHLSRSAQTAKVQWSLQTVCQRREGAQWEDEVFDVLVMGQQGMLLRSQRPVVRPARQRLLWWLDSSPSLALAQDLLGQLATGMGLEVYLVGSPQQQAAALELVRWLEAAGIPYYRLLYGMEPASLKAALTTLRIHPDFALIPHSLGWDEIGRLMEMLPCPLLVTRE